MVESPFDGAEAIHVNAWLRPLSDDQPCGPDLEFDADALEMEQAAGKPANQFGPGEPADWLRVRELSEALLERTRDLRVLLWWSRAQVNLEGFAALPGVLVLFHGMLDSFWDHLHPVPDDDDTDALARLSALGGFDKLNSVLGDIRNSRLSGDPRLDGLRVRDVELALAKIPPRPDETPRSLGEVAGILAEAADVSAALRQQTGAALASVGQIQALMNERFSADKVVDLTTLRGMLTGVQSVLPTSPDAVEEVRSKETPLAEAPVRSGNGVNRVDSRQDAVRAIELVCAYLERSEPTNPAQLLLRRAARVIDKNFLQLVHELAPDSVNEVARIMGVDPNTVSDPN